MGWLDTKIGTCVVLGATGGIGRAVAARLAGHAETVIGIGRAAPEESAGEWHEYRCCPDVSREALDKVFGRNERYDLVVNCIGLGYFAPLNGNHSEYWEAMIESNFTSLLNVLSVITARAGLCDRLIHVSSLAAHRPTSSPGGMVYGLTKAAAHQLVIQTRSELRRNGSRMKLCCVTPGFVGDTKFGSRFFDPEPSASVDLFERFEPLKPQDVAELVAFAALAPTGIDLTEIVCRPIGQPD